MSLLEKSLGGVCEKTIVKNFAKPTGKHPPRRYSEGYKIVCQPVLLFFCSSVLLSRIFLGIRSLVFPKFWNGFRNPYEVVRDKTEFLL